VRALTLVLHRRADRAIALDHGADAVHDENAQRQFRIRLRAIDVSLAETGTSAEQIARLEGERTPCCPSFGQRSASVDDGADSATTRSARKAVSGCTRAGIARLRGPHPSSGNTWGLSIETGSTCVYAPNLAVRR
jgi:hypothetical protein